MRNSMPSDPYLAHEQCNEVGLSGEFIEPDTLAIRVSGDVTLRFVNNDITHFLDDPEAKNDALIDVSDDTPLHPYGHEFQFSDSHGHYVFADYFE